ncbi:Tat pathway signal sequence protein [Rutstroemia sp. NJR-2017a WRK4]|nr:Tat pathway signal sequence protein [Rutstroemia sp. NJR-2017a WRK4]
MRQQFLPNKYMYFNETESSSAWDDIKAGHGEVSIDPKWAVAQGLPPSMSHPIETEKMVYTITAYHSLHCLKFIRQHYIALKNSSEIDWELHHDFHCFDALRQNIMCAADDNLLHATGHRDAGYGQVVQCKDWDALREWATERPACYHDHLGSSKGHWGHCDNGEDGLPRNSLME